MSAVLSALIPLAALATVVALPALIMRVTGGARLSPTHTPQRDPKPAPAARPAPTPEKESP